MTTPIVDLPQLQKDDIPHFTFQDLLDCCRFNHIDDMDIHVGSDHGQRYVYIRNILENPLQMRDFLKQFPAEDRNASQSIASKLNGGKTFSGSKAPGLQQPITNQLMTAFGNELHLLLNTRLKFLKYDLHHITWKYFTNLFYPGMQSYNRNYLPHTDPFSYAANLYLSDHGKESGTSFFRYQDRKTERWHYNLNSIYCESSLKDGTRRRYLDLCKERYGYTEKPNFGREDDPVLEWTNDPKEEGYIGLEPWVLWEGDDIYERYIFLPAEFNSLSFYKGMRWHTVTYDAQRSKHARYSMVGVIE